MTGLLANRVRLLMNHQHVAVFALVGGLSAASVGLWALFAVGSTAPDGSLPVPWWVLAAGFAVVESFVVSLHFRSESGSFSLLEMPLVFGLLFVAPGWLWAAMIVGGVVGLAGFRRQPGLKVAFNVANLSLQVMVAALTFDLLLGRADPLSPRGWMAMLLGTMLAAVVQISMINVVIWITERRLEPRQAWVMIGFGSLVAGANAVQALIAILVIVAEPWGGLLLVCSTGVLFISYRAYVSERDHRERVEFLHNSTLALRDRSEMTSAAEALLVEATSMFRARTAELVMFAVPDADEPPASFTREAGVTDARVIAGETEQEAIAVAEAAVKPLLIVAGRGSRVVVDYLVGLGVGDALVGTMWSEQRPIGLLIVGDRLGSVTTFTAEDRRLFETLVNQAAVAFENGQLEQILFRLRELETELEFQARHDSLTGLANRTLFNQRIDEALRSQPDDGLDLLYIDLDDFKLVNDRLGHAAGDALLREVAGRITDSIRPADLAARLGGDEFAVLLVSASDAHGIASRIIGSLGAPFLLGADEVRIGASVGIGGYSGSESSFELLHRADRAMYTAKKRGKGSVVSYTGDLERDDARQQALQTALRRGIADEEFEVAYQPIIRLADLSIVGAEALVRWQQKSGALLGPADFIAEAERSGLILSIDRLVRLSVFSQIESFANMTSGPFFTSINLSARHLQLPDLVDEIASDLLATGAHPNGIVLEITESAFAEDLCQAAEVLAEVRRLGIRVALDDFGTGYSSLSYLRDLPIDILKIAQPFIGDLSTSNDGSFVQAITTLGQALSLTVVAEGIENPATLAALKQMGCDLGQGFYFAKPMAAETLEALLRQPLSGLVTKSIHDRAGHFGGAHPSR